MYNGDWREGGIMNFIGRLEDKLFYKETRNIWKTGRVL